VRARNEFFYYSIHVCIENNFLHILYTMGKRGRPSQVMRGRRRLIRKRRGMLWKGALTAPSTHVFVRTATYSNSSNTGIDGSGFVDKGADALKLNLSAGAGAIRYGSGSMFFTLDSLPDYTEFTTLFDTYRIEKVKIKFTPFFGTSLTGAAVSATSAQCTVLWHDIIDTDDKDVPTNSDTGLSQLRQYKSYKTRSLASGRSFSRTLIPRSAQAVYSGAFTAYAQTPQKIWYDCNNADVQFYGYKFIVEANYAGSDTILYVKAEVKMKLSLRDVR